MFNEVRKIPNTGAGSRSTAVFEDEVVAIEVSAVSGEKLPCAGERAEGLGKAAHLDECQ